MRGSRWFIFFVLAFLLLISAIEYYLPRKFVWVLAFSHYGEQPFGCAVFDSLLTVSLPSGYTLPRKTFYRMEQEGTVHNKGILLIAINLPLGRVDIEALLKMADRGNKITLVSSSFTEILEDTLKFDCTYSYLKLVDLKKHATSLLKRDSIYWVGDLEVYSRQVFRFYPQFCKSYFRCYDSLSVCELVEINPANDMRHALDKLDSMTVSRNYHSLVTMVRPWREGEITLVSTLSLLTNYGVLDERSATYIFRILSQMGELPIVRTGEYMKETAQAQRSPLRYFLSRRPLRWAIYLSMSAILLFMVFTTWRQQRAIPVIQEPENKSPEFTKLIGTLYYQKNDHVNLVHKKFTYLVEVLRREVQVDVEEMADDKRSFHRIAQKTGTETEEISRLTREIGPVIYGGRVLSGEEMKEFTDKMNEIINHIQGRYLWKRI